MHAFLSEEIILIIKTLRRFKVDFQMSRGWKFIPDVTEQARLPRLSLVPGAEICSDVDDLSSVGMFTNYISQVGYLVDVLQVHYVRVDVMLFTNDISQVGYPVDVL